MTYRFLELPSVPAHLILPVDEALKLENIFGGYTDNYTIHEVQDELRDYLQVLFPDYTKFRYQTLKKEIPVHKDRGRDIAVNYIIDTGGEDARTVWYEEDYTTPTHDVQLPKNRWHELRVDTYHSVTGITSLRYAITVAP